MVKETEPGRNHAEGVGTKEETHKHPNAEAEVSMAWL